MTTDNQDRWKRTVWTVGKIALAVLILGAVGRRFYLDLGGLDFQELTVEPGWLLLSAVLYIVGLGCACLFWQRLLRHFGQGPPAAAIVRAYFIGHLGKYVPGKAWALLLRASLLRSNDVGLGIGLLTGFYEVLTTMASGALLAAVIFSLQPPQATGLSWSPALGGLLLVAILSVPLWPVAFNFLLARLARRFESMAALDQSPVRLGVLAEGLLITAAGWLILGLSLWTSIRGVLPDLPALTVSTWLHCVAALGLAYVAGFLAIVLPGGVGVREFLLLILLEPLGDKAGIALAVLLVRLVWTAAELVIAAVAFWLPPAIR